MCLQMGWGEETIINQKPQWSVTGTQPLITSSPREEGRLPLPPCNPVPSPVGPTPKHILKPLPLTMATPLVLAQPPPPSWPTGGREPFWNVSLNHRSPLHSPDNTKDKVLTGTSHSLQRTLPGPPPSDLLTLPTVSPFPENPEHTLTRAFAPAAPSAQSTRSPDPSIPPSFTCFRCFTQTSQAQRAFPGHLFKWQHTQPALPSLSESRFKSHLLTQGLS